MDNRKLVSFCLEPSQPQRITPGLRTIETNRKNGWEVAKQVLERPTDSREIFFRLHYKVVHQIKRVPHPKNTTMTLLFTGKTAPKVGIRTILNFVLSKAQNV